MTTLSNATTRQDVINLLENADDIDRAKILSGFSFYHECYRGNSEVIKALIEFGCDVKYVVYGQNCLSIICEKNNLPLLKEILKYKDMRDLINSDCGLFPLSVACKNNYMDIYDILLENGADVNFTNSEGTTALMAAVQYHQLDMVRRLLADGADPNLVDEYGRTAIFECTDLSILLQLLAYGANPIHQNSYGLTPLHNFIKKYDVSYPELVKALLDAGVSPNIQDSKGTTPLMRAFDAGRYDIVKILLAYNPDIDIIDIEGRSAKNYIEKLKPAHLQHIGLKEYI